MSNLIDMEATVHLLRTEHRIENAYVEHTGGGTYAVYAGPTRTEDGAVRYAALAGPGYDETIDGDRVFAFDASEIYVGCDDQGEADPVDLSGLGVTTPEQIAKVIAAQAGLDDPTTALTEDAARALLFG